MKMIITPSRLDDNCERIRSFNILQCSLSQECDRIYRQIDRRLLVIPSGDSLSREFFLGYNCRLLKEYADQILDFAFEYDFSGCPAVNGFYSWIRVVNNYGSLVLTSFSKKGVQATLKDRNLIQSSLIILSSLDVVLKIRSDSIAQQNNNILMIDAGSLVVKATGKVCHLKNDARRQNDSICEMKGDDKGLLTDEDDGYGGSKEPEESSYYSSSSSSVINLYNNRKGSNNGTCSLFSLYESCMTEAILIYQECIFDPTLGLKDKLKLWHTFLSLLSNKNILPLEHVYSIGSSLISSSVSPLRSTLMGNPVISMLVNNPLLSLPFLSSSAYATRKVITVPGSQWVVNSGQKKQVYMRQDFNTITHDFGYNNVSFVNRNVKRNPRKEIIIFCSSSRHESCFDISNQTGIPSIEVCLSSSQSAGQDNSSSFIPFPHDLQIMLDLYSWLNSSGSEKSFSRKRLLGFRPESVILVGSGPEAGRTLLALCLVIHEVRSIMRHKCFLMKFPSKLFSINGNFMSKLLVSPSKTLSFIKSINGNFLSNTASSMDCLSMSSCVAWVPKGCAERTTLSWKQNNENNNSTSASFFPKASSSRMKEQTFYQPVSLTNLAVMQAFSLISMTKSSLYETLMFIKGIPTSLISSSIPYASGIFLHPLLHPRTFLSNRLKQLNTLFDALSVSDKHYETQVRQEIFSDEESEVEDIDADFFYDSPNNVRNWSALSKQETTRESREFKEFVQKIPRLNAVASNPFVSPLLFEDFSVLGSIDLHLISSHFDESLDDNVSLARVWTGKVHLDVIEDNLFDLTVEGLITKPLSASQGHSIVVKTINES